MARPRMCRRVGLLPDCVLFKPAGVPSVELQEITLTMDELESLRLADMEGLYQQQAADRMGVSRQTFGRIVTEARAKVARVLVQGLALKIEGGKISVAAQRRFQCLECEHEWSLSAGTGRPADCPECQSPKLQRADRSCCDVCPDTEGAARSGVDAGHPLPAQGIPPESHPLDRGVQFPEGRLT